MLLGFYFGGVLIPYHILIFSLFLDHIIRPLEFLNKYNPLIFLLYGAIKYYAFLFFIYHWNCASGYAIQFKKTEMTIFGGQQEHQLKIDA